MIINWPAPMFHIASSANRSAQKCLAASSVRRTAPDVVPTATILIRFCVAIDIIDVARAGAGLVFDFLRFDFSDVAFAAIAFPKKMAGQARFRSLTLTLSLSRLVPDLLSHHVTGTAVKA